MSVMENAQQLYGLGGQLVEEGSAAATSAATGLDTIRQDLQRVTEICENSTQQAALLLGEGHNGVGVIVGSAAVVAGKVDGALALIGQLVDEINTAVIQSVLSHGEVMRNTANSAMGVGA